MSTATVNQPVRSRSTSKIPPPLPASAKAARKDGPNVWERWSVVLTTAFGVSMMLHVILFLALAFWMLVNPVEDRLSVDSALGLNNEAPTVDLTEVDMKAAPAPKTDSLRQRTAIVLDAANARRNDGPEIDIKIPEVGGGGNGAKGHGSDGKGFFGTGKEANSYVFVVDCSGSMRDDDRFDRAIAELRRVIKSLKPTQKFFVIFYNHHTIPMYDVQKRFQGRMRGGRRRGRFQPIRTQKKLSASKYRLKRANESVTQRADSWIRRIKPEGETEPAEGLRLALAMKPEVIYFLTDGEIPDDSDVVIRNANKSKVRVNTIALGYAGSAGILERIAKENNGRFRFVK